MSRRTRIKVRPKQRFTLAHHSSYATSTSHFPRSYSQLGNDIQFPNKLLPLYSNNKINFVGDSAQVFFESLDEKEHNLHLKTLKQVSISIAGQKYQNGSSFLNLLLFGLSMCCFCLGYLFKLHSFRSRSYPKYRFQDYKGLAKIIQTFSDVETLVINIQDNQINLEKAELIQDAIFRSNIKHFVLRNMAYFIEVQRVTQFFQRIRNKKGLNFAFVWENFVLESEKESLVDQQIGLMNISDEIS